jgi:hypothetical protein
MMRHVSYTRKGLGELSDALMELRHNGEEYISIKSVIDLVLSLEEVAYKEEKTYK